jgi:hypothetical protein
MKTGTNRGYHGLNLSRSGLKKNVPALSSIRYLLPLRKFDIFATYRIRIIQEEFYTFTHFTLKGLLPPRVGKVTLMVCNNGKTKMIEISEEKIVNLNENKLKSALPRGKNLKTHTNASYLPIIPSFTSKHFNHHVLFPPLKNCLKFASPCIIIHFK